MILFSNPMKIFLLGNFQGCFTVQLSMFIFVFILFAVVFYRVSNIYNITLFFLCQQLFKTFFKSFLLFLLENLTEKEGFEPSRRVSDLYP